MDDLVKTYLKWRYSQPDPTVLAASIAAPSESPYNFTIEAVDIYSLQISALIQRSEDSKSPAVALVDCGYLGTTPTSPTLAISLRTLELYRCIRLRKPSFSIEAFAKVICDLYMVYFSDYFSHSDADQSKRSHSVKDIIQDWRTHSMHIC
jgi:hypothetical protein